MSDRFNGARLTLESRRQIMHSQKKSREQEIFNTVPEITNISEEINRTGNELSYLIITHGDSSLISELKNRMALLKKRKDSLLTENGYPVDYLNLHYFCNECKDTGFFNGKICSCMKKQILAERQKELSAISPMPDCRIEDYTLDYYPNKIITTDSGASVNPRRHMEKIFSFVKKYIDSFTYSSRSLLMFGNSGLGKTHLACAIANEVMKKGYTVMYASARSLFAKYDQIKNDSDELTSDILDCDLFILDDLGAEYSTNYSLTALYTIINTREINNKPCIFTTNIPTHANLQRRYGEKIASRLMGSCHKLYFWGDDIRIMKQK